MTSRLDRQAPGQARTKEAPDAAEFSGLKRSGLARLKDAENPANSFEGAVEADERLVTDLISACRAVAKAVDALPPLPTM